MWEELLQLDQQWIVFLNNLGSETFDPFWAQITKTLTWSPLFLFVLYQLYRGTSQKTFLKILLELTALILVVQLTVFLTKTNTMRLRPNNDPMLQSLLRKVINPNSYSFFSGHAATSFAAATFLYSIGRRYYRYIAVIFLWAIFYTYSRLYLGVHYVSDIFVGMAFGILLGYLCCKLHLWRLQRSDHSADGQTIADRQ